MTNPIPDIANADCLLIVGSNLAENHPIVAGWVLDAKERGAKIIVVDPRRTPTAWMADLFLQITPGTDIALVNALINVVIAEGLYNAAFVDKNTTGFADLKRLVAEYTPDTVEDIVGVPAAHIEQAARWFAQARAAAIIYCMGITQHTKGSDNVMNLSNLALVCGHIGRPGTGVLPLRGQNNVQGACDMGALAALLPGYVSVTDDAERERVAAGFGITHRGGYPNSPRDRALPSKPGLTVVEMMSAAAARALRAMYIMGEDPIVSDPNSHHVEEGLRKLEFLVVQDIFLTDTARLAHLVLPAACWAEKEGTVTGTERRVQWMNKAVEPPEEARADLDIVRAVAHRLGFGPMFARETAEEVLAEINRVVPAYAGITAERVRSTVGGIHWPCPSFDHPGTPILHTAGFKTSTGRARLVPVGHRSPVEQTSEEYPLLLTTGRVVMHYNAGSMTRRTKPLLDRSPHLFVEMSPLDAGRLGIENNQDVNVITRRGSVTAKAVITPSIKEGVVFVPFHFPGANALTVDALDPKAKIPEFKVAACRVERSKSGHQSGAA